MPSAKDILFGTKAKTKKLSTLTPEQEELMSTIKEGLTKGTGAFADIYGKFNPQEFEEGVAKPQLKKFKEEILPQLQEKFIGGGQTGGSGQLRYQNKAAVDFQSKLAELLYNAQQGQKQNRIAGVNTTIGRNAVENLHIPGTEGLTQGAIKSFAQGAGSAAVGGIPMPGGGEQGVGVGTPGGGVSYGASNSPGYNPSAFTTADYGTRR